MFRALCIFLVCVTMNSKGQTVNGKSQNSMFIAKTGDGMQKSNKNRKALSERIKIMKTEKKKNFFF